MSNTRAHVEIAGRPLLVYKQNLLDHIGTVSSFAIRPNRPKWCAPWLARASVWHTEWFDGNPRDGERAVLPQEQPCSKPSSLVSNSLNGAKMACGNLTWWGGV